jgi:hypothetical protein
MKYRVFFGGLRGLRILFPKCFVKCPIAMRRVVLFIFDQSVTLHDQQ